jgi:hypothetical protein
MKNLVTFSPVGICIANFTFPNVPSPIVFPNIYCPTIFLFSAAFPFELRIDGRTLEDDRLLGGPGGAPLLLFEAFEATEAPGLVPFEDFDRPEEDDDILELLKSFLFNQY